MASSFSRLSWFFSACLQGQYVASILRNDNRVSQGWERGAEWKHSLNVNFVSPYFSTPHVPLPLPLLNASSYPCSTPTSVYLYSPEANATGVIVCALTWAAMNILSYYQMQAHLHPGAPSVRLQASLKHTPFDTKYLLYTPASLQYLTSPPPAQFRLNFIAILWHSRACMLCALNIERELARTN